MSELTIITSMNTLLTIIQKIIGIVKQFFGSDQEKKQNMDRVFHYTTITHNNLVNLLLQLDQFPYDQIQNVLETVDKAEIKTILTMITPIFPLTNIPELEVEDFYSIYFNR
jgi:hypothetical protein